MSKQSVWLAAGLLAGLWASPATATTAAQEPIQPIEAAVIRIPPRWSWARSCSSIRACPSPAPSPVIPATTWAWAARTTSRAPSANWRQGGINSPTVLNSSLSIAQFWDGRAKDLSEQAGGPIANPMEMASSHELAVQVLNSIPG